MTAALKRRINDLERMTDASPCAPRLIILASPGSRLERLSDGQRFWQRSDGEADADFLARVETDIGDGPPVLLASA